MFFWFVVIYSSRTYEETVLLYYTTTVRITIAKQATKLGDLQVYSIAGRAVIPFFKLGDRKSDGGLKPPES